jgi:hypothetical protein
MHILVKFSFFLSRSGGQSGTQFLPASTPTSSPQKICPDVPVGDLVAAALEPPPTPPVSRGAPWYRGSNFTCIPCNRQFTAQVGVKKTKVRTDCHSRYSQVE